MYLLPIARREAQAAARRGSLYRTRYVAGGLAGFGGVLALFWASNVWTFSNSPGRFLFWFTTGMAALFAAGSGMFLTVDALSREKRQNTLGLLFLTELRGYDIVMGKLASGAATAMSSFLTMIPILAISVCVGGVTGRQFWRTTLALVALLFFSLCLGLLISAFLRREGPGVTLFAGLMALPLVAGYLGLYVSGEVKGWLLLVNPFYPLLAASELDLGLAPPGFMTPLLGIPGEHYGGAIGTIVGMGLACLALASAVLPYTVRNEGGTRSWRRVGFRKKKGMARWQQGGFRTLHRHPVVWLTVKDKSATATIWVLFAAALIFYWRDPLKGMNADLGGLFYALVAHYLLKWHVAYEAGKLVSQEKETGVLETLLTTPMNAALLLKSKQLALRRYFLPPLLFVLGVHGWYIMRALEADYTGAGIWVAFGSVVVLLVDSFSLSWLGLWEGLSTRQTLNGFLRTLLFGLVAPWLPFFLVTGVIWFIFGSDFNPPPGLIWTWGFLSATICGLGVALWAVGRAHYQLRKRIAEVE